MYLGTEDLNVSRDVEVREEVPRSFGADTALLL